MAIPIWKDKLVNLGSTDVSFRIYDSANSVVVYSGVAHAKPDGGNIYVRINDICADYLATALPTMTDRAFTQNMEMPSLKVQKYSGGSWTDVETVQFYNDWSYDYSFSSTLLSYPITDRVDARMFILISKLQTTTITATYTNKSGTNSNRTATVSGTKDGTAVFKVNAISNPAKVVVAGYTYKVVTECARYALIYMNAYGGMDQFLVEGNSVESDSLDRHTVGVEYTNTNISNRGKKEFVNEDTKTWTLNSGLLTDTESAKMHHLLGSPLVYLHELATGNIIPVVMQTDTWEVKTFKNQGNRMFNYTFTVELAQNRIRR